MFKCFAHLSNPALRDEAKAAITDYWEALTYDSPALPRLRFRRLLAESELHQRGLTLAE